MKLMHISDLHLGKRVSEFSMLEDQAYILDQIVQIAKTEQPDALLIAGDVYDKTIPSADAVELLDRFLVQLIQQKIPVFLTAGNHDSAERLAFASRLLQDSRLYISPVFDGSLHPVRLDDEHGPVDIWMLPFVKPVHVRACFPDADIQTYTDAVKTALSACRLDPAARHVLVTHQFVTGSQRSDSEEQSAGGSDNVDQTVFQPFDYVALGHLHRPQNCSPSIRYSGSPLKYSFSEARDQKSVTFVDLDPEGNAEIHTIPLRPLRDLKEIRGTYKELTLRAYYEGTTLPDDYLHITLTDEEDIPDVMQKLRTIYPNLMKVDYDNARTRARLDLEEMGPQDRMSPLELFKTFYCQQNGKPMSPEQEAYVKEQMEEIWEEAL